MKAFVHVPRRRLSRRTFLRGGGVAMALPLLEAMRPALGAAAHAAEAGTAVPRRMVAIETNMGIMPQFFFPEKAGADYDAHALPGEARGASQEHDRLFGRQPSGRDRRAHGRALLPDRHAASRARRLSQRRLARPICRRADRQSRRAILRCRWQVSDEGKTLSYTRSGAPIPAEGSPQKLFQKLFVQGKPEEVEANVEALRQGRSMLDFVGEQSKRLNRTLSKGDQQRMDQYFTSVRELEQRLHSSEAWEYKPKPVVNAQAAGRHRRHPRIRQQDAADVRRDEAGAGDRFDPLITLFIDTTVIHNITHHGNRPEVIAELRGKKKGSSTRWTAS